MAAETGNLGGDEVTTGASLRFESISLRGPGAPEAEWLTGLLDAVALERVGLAGDKAEAAAGTAGRTCADGKFARFISVGFDALSSMGVAAVEGAATEGFRGNSRLSSGVAVA
jgi:hypothetical protein